jgi:hypothetical protein
MGLQNGYSISHVFLAGSMMQYFDPTPFSQIRNTFALLDLDTGNTTAQDVFKSACKNAGILPAQLSRYSLENYYSLNAIRSTFKELVPAKLESLENAIPVWEQLSDPIHSANWWKGTLKSFRHIHSILENMTATDLEDTDLLEFCKTIKSIFK